MSLSFRSLTGFLLVISGLAIAQVPSPRSPAVLDFNAIPRPPVPTDALELVTGAAQPVQDAQRRIAAIGLLDKARELSNVRAQPYDLKTTFIASGGLASDGNWNLEDTSRGRKYRWTASGPNYSAVNLYPDGTSNGLYGNRVSGILPLRLLQVRSAMWFVFPTPGPQASLRTATGFLNGAPQNCVLVVIGAGNRSFAGDRNWEESEYCADAKTGLLSQYSPAPGLYVRFDYSSGIQFHGKFIPTSFTIFENGRPVAEARTVSVTEPPAATDAIFDPSGLTPLGSGRAMNPGSNMPLILPAPGQRLSTASARMQVVSLHGNVAGDGSLTEVGILASTDPSMNQAAIDEAVALARRVPVQPGATKQSAELFLTFEFVTAAR